jgi:DNA polymerase-3 subunit epsilon
VRGNCPNAAGRPSPYRVRDAVTENAPLFAVVDIETTGFSPIVGDRIVEIAIVRVGGDGSTVDEYVTLVNPLRDIGPTHVHGITQEDVEHAPMFTEVVGDVLARLAGVIFVGHNARYDRDFLAAELSAAGIFLPAIPSLCTLKLGYRLHPELGNHRLATCCEAAGIDHPSAHSAIDDARVTAALLSCYLAEAQEVGIATLKALGLDPDKFPESWPSLQATGRIAVRTPGERTAESLPYLARLVTVLTINAAEEEVAPYIDLLDRALEDRRVTEDEAKALETIAREWGLSREQVLAAHHSYLESLVTAAFADGRVTYTERQDLDAVAFLLAIDPSVLEAMLYSIGESST